MAGARGSVERWLAPTLALLACLLAAVIIIPRALDQHAFRRATELTGGDPHRGEVLLVSYGCIACHEIPGVPGATGRIGPPLEGVGARAFVGGTRVNSLDNMIAWIRDPRAIDPQTAMPNTGVTAEDARDIVAYLYSLQ